MNVEVAVNTTTSTLILSSLTINLGSTGQYQLCTPQPRKKGGVEDVPSPKLIDKEWCRYLQSEYLDIYLAIPAITGFTPAPACTD